MKLAKSHIVAFSGVRTGRIHSCSVNDGGFPPFGASLDSRVVFQPGCVSQPFSVMASPVLVGL